MKKTNFTSYQKVILRLKKIYENGNKKPGKTYITHQTNNQNRGKTPLIQTLKRRTYCWYVTLHKTKIVNKGAKSTTAITFHAASHRTKTIRNLKLKILKEPYDNQLLNEDCREAKYLAQEDRNIIKDGLLYRQYSGDTSKVKNLQVLLPKQLVDEFIQHQHGMCSKHPGITKVIQRVRERYYYPGLALKLCQHISQCKECLQTKRTPNSTITPPIIDMSKIAMGPEDAMQMVIVPFDDPSGGYNAIITAMDVFSR